VASLDITDDHPTVQADINALCSSFVDGFSTPDCADEEGEGEEGEDEDSDEDDLPPINDAMKARIEGTLDC